jgi:hypothetical protein
LQAPPAADSKGGLAAYFKFAGREARPSGRAQPADHVHGHGPHRIFLNRNIIAKPLGLDRWRSRPDGLIAGIMTIAMGVIANYPFALAAGLGINAIVAFGLTARASTPRRDGRGIVLEVAITIRRVGPAARWSRSR